MKDHKKNSVLKALKKWEYLRDYEELKKIDRKFNAGNENPVSNSALYYSGNFLLCRL